MDRKLFPSCTLIWLPGDYPSFALSRPFAAAWFEQVKHPGEDAYEAARWLPADLRATLTSSPIRGHVIA